MELPIFILGLSILAPRTRSNILFAATFFLTRIVFHIVLGVNWFYGCLQGFLRRYRKTKELALKEGKGVSSFHVLRYVVVFTH
ncbi:hypothetical protein Moror_4464 [Moniliophthora roreri MCA 2997]|uniref:Uncharacterized protein n=1 Tax=Moniliophthora roreri (strain MCA 2997) TaxID=1381753 RepID=V2X043_MONRO|nr:hypothetical protein Moror_4464 [Moniliophthora roreri MCA 2997]